MNKKKITSQILVFLVLFVIIIIAVLNQKNNVHTETNSPEYVNLNINQNGLNIFYLDVGQGDRTLIDINPLKYNLDGTGRKQAIFFERKYRLAFFFNCHEYEVIQIF